VYLEPVEPCGVFVAVADEHLVTGDWQPLAGGCDKFVAAELPQVEYELRVIADQTLATGVVEEVLDDPRATRLETVAHAVDEHTVEGGAQVRAFLSYRL